MIGTHKHFNSAATNTAVNIKADAGVLTFLEASNPNGSAVFIQVFDRAAVDVTVGTTTPAWSLFVPANGAQDKALGDGQSFDTAISYAVTTGATNGVAAASNSIVNAGYR